MFWVSFPFTCSWDILGLHSSCPRRNPSSDLLPFISRWWDFYWELFNSYLLILELVSVLEQGPRPNSLFWALVPTKSIVQPEAHDIYFDIDCLDLHLELKFSKYLRKSFHYHIKCIVATFLAALMWRRPLNSVALAAATHRWLKGVSDRMGTQVGIQVINKCKV